MSSEAEVLGLDTSSRASPKPRLTYWTTWGQGCLAPPLQTQSWTQVLQDAPGMNPCGTEGHMSVLISLAEPLTGHACGSSCMSPSPQRGPHPGGGPGKGKKEMRAGLTEPHSGSSPATQLHPRAEHGRPSSSKQGFQGLPLLPCGDTQVHGRSRGVAAGKGPLGSQSEGCQKQSPSHFCPGCLDTLMHPAPSKGMSHSPEPSPPPAVFDPQGHSGSRISRAAKEGEGFWDGGWWSGARPTQRPEVPLLSSSSLHGEAQAGEGTLLKLPNYHMSQPNWVTHETGLFLTAANAT